MGYTQKGVKAATFASRAFSRHCKKCLYPAKLIEVGEPRNRHERRAKQKLQHRSSNGRATAS